MITSYYESPSSSSSDDEDGANTNITNEGAVVMDIAPPTITDGTSYAQEADTTITPVMAASVLTTPFNKNDSSNVMDTTTNSPILKNVQSPPSISLKNDGGDVNNHRPTAPSSSTVRITSSMDDNDVAAVDLTHNNDNDPTITTIATTTAKLSIPLVTTTKTIKQEEESTNSIVKNDLVSLYLQSKCGNVHESSYQPISWRTRDTVYSLLSIRQRRLQALSSGVKTATAPTIKLTKFPVFVDLLFVDLTTDATKKQMAIRAFDASAISVLRAVQKQIQTPLHQPLTTNTTIDELPMLLQVMESLTTMKDNCYGRHTTKKRKVKEEGSSGSSTMTTTKKRKKTTAAAGSTSSDKGGTAKDGSSTLNCIPCSSTSGGGMFGGGGGGGTNVDARATVSRAILCAAVSYTFQQLTPKFPNDTEDIQVLNVPQNTHVVSQENTKQKPIINMGAVMMSAEIFAKRSMEQAKGAALRGEKRRKWRMECSKRELEDWQMEYGVERLDDTTAGSDDDWVDSVLRNSLRSCKNAYALDTNSDDNSVNVVTEGSDNDDDNDNDDDETKKNEHGTYYTSLEDDNKNDNEQEVVEYNYKPKTINQEWKEQCMPRLLDIMFSGPGHVVLCDYQWRTRADRIVQVLHEMAFPSTTTTTTTATTAQEIDATTTTQPEGDFRSSSNETTGGEDSNKEKNARCCHQNDPNYGPHLIITTAADLKSFMKLFAPLDYSFIGTGCGSSSNFIPITANNNDTINNGARFRLRALQYTGSNAKRRNLRIKHFTSTSLSGLPDGPYHAVVTTYESFIKDYTHFCQIPFQAVVLDDGMSWLGTAYYDPNGQIGKVFEMGVWSKSDHHAGLAGVGYDSWDFSLEVKADGSLVQSPTSSSTPSSQQKEISTSSSSSQGATTVEEEENNNDKKANLVGLTARHKILIASSLHSKYRDVTYPAPVPGLLSFLIPQFADVVREEWDRSRIHTCKESMDHVRKLLCRGVCIYTGSNNEALRDMYSVVLSAMLGTLDLKQFPPSARISIIDSGSDSGSDLDDTQTLSAFKKSRTDNATSPLIAQVPREISTDEMVSNGKIVQSRRSAASWLRSSSAIRYEIGGASLDYIVNALKARASSGYVCEEVVAASSITSSGAGGVVTGPAGYRTAVRCGRTFGSEQGLRQHIAALHAPPGTWLCRSCYIDCGTSQARTHHERSCGTNAAGTSGGVKENSTGGGIPTVGQGIGSVTTSKQMTGGHGKEGPKDKDKDGCFRVPSYRGVWVNPMGKHFVKINGVSLTEEQLNKPAGQESFGGSTILFKSADEAARAYDDTVRQRGEDKNTEMNFKEDGSRILYEDAAVNAAAGRGLEMLGGGASSVVPALSVINIKDLPKGVVPLLRDPKQTSRTGGNSKRYIYAYRGVCRQARKGHDRWQSQISFGGTNHYLGTFDSEWDAAAIYAWAHLILYGEEATKKAQKEGEEAVAAYEQEKKDIAEGKIVAPPPKPAKKRKAVSKGKPTASKGKSERKKEKASDRSAISKNASSTKEVLKPAVPKMAQKDLHGHGDNLPSDDNDSMRAASERIFAIRKKMWKNNTRSIEGICNSVCIPVDSSESAMPVGCAMLVGLSSSDCGWDIGTFVRYTQQFFDEFPDTFVPALRSEYGPDGLNFRFRTIVQGTSCFIGKAGKNLEQASTAFGLQGAELGGTIADIDCNIGGIDGSCNEIAACISYSSSISSFQFEACNDKDIVTLNGEQIKSTMGSFPLESEAICGVGSRVFMFVLPSI